MNPQRRLACAAGFSFMVAGLTGCGDDPLLARRVSPSVTTTSCTPCSRRSASMP